MTLQAFICTVTCMGCQKRWAESVAASDMPSAAQESINGAVAQGHQNVIVTCIRQPQVEAQATALVQETLREAAQAARRIDQ